MGGNNLTHIDSNIDIDTKTNTNPDKNMIGNKLLEKNSRINIEDLF